MPEIPSELRVLVTLGIGLLLVLLRLDAERFGAAEYDEATSEGYAPSLRSRLAWYTLGTALVLAVAVVRPAEDFDLSLGTGNREAAIIAGFAWAALGTGQALVFALYRYR